jgi:hypothetical protein
MPGGVSTRVLSDAKQRHYGFAFASKKNGAAFAAAPFDFAAMKALTGTASSR